MRWIAFLILLVASGCASLDVRNMTLSVNVSVNFPAPKDK